VNRPEDFEALAEVVGGQPGMAAALAADQDKLDALQEPKPSRPVRWIPIPPGQIGTPCRSCGQLIYFSEENPKTRKKSPVSIKHASAFAPTSTTYGQGISHFADCPHAAQHRKAP
jgi:hypothetical protein